MYRKRKHIRFVAGLLVAALAALAFDLWYLPWARTWGATPAEVARAMPGDDSVPDPTFVATRAITIHAPSEVVWPWIVQMGYRRAGFYGYDWLDNDAAPSATRLLPEFKPLHVGDHVAMSPRKLATVVALEPNRLLVLRFGPRQHTWCWVWELRPDGPGSTRVIARLSTNERSPLHRLALNAAEVFAVRKSLLGLKARAES